jgi:cysteine synthase
VTALVYLRNARRALRLNRTGTPVSGGAAVAFAFGLAFALGMPAVAQSGATHIVRNASAEVVAGGRLSPQRRRVVRALTSLSGEGFEDLVGQYDSETNPERKSLLAEAFWEVTGKDISNFRSRELFD